MITLSQTRWLLGEATVRKVSQEASLVHGVPYPYPSRTLVLGADFCDREKLDQQEQILKTQVPDFDQHTTPLSTGVGHHRWFNAAAYGRFAQVRSVIISPLTGRFQMYYLVHGHLDISAGWTGGAYAACYAESDDGIHWELPELGKNEVFGSRRNNVIFPAGYEANVILDPHDCDPARRYKAFLHPGPKVAFSSDGIHWTAPLPAFIETEIGRSDGDTVFGWDERIGQYVAYPRPWGIPPGLPPGTAFKRRVGRAVSDDFMHWREHTAVYEAPETEGRWTEIERMHVFKYGHLYIGLANVYEGYEEERVAISHMVAQTHCELVYSEDGIRWNGFPGRPVFMDSLSGRGMFLSGGQPVEKDGLLWFYHSSSCQVHGELPTGMLPGLSRIESHRLVGWRSGEREATLETQPFECPGGALSVYASIAPRGHFRVAVLAKDGMHHLDYAAYRCNYSQGRSACHPVCWQRESNLERLKGQTISLKFYFQDADLHGFVFNPVS